MKTSLGFNCWKNPYNERCWKDSNGRFTLFSFSSSIQKKDVQKSKPLVFTVLLLESPSVALRNEHCEVILDLFPPICPMSIFQGPALVSHWYGKAGCRNSYKQAKQQAHYWRGHGMESQAEWENSRRVWAARMTARRPHGKKDRALLSKAYFSRHRNPTVKCKHRKSLIPLSGY